MAVTSYDELLARIGGGYTLSELVNGLNESASVVMGGNNIAFYKLGDTKALPSLPSGVSAYIPTSMSFGASTSGTYAAIVAEIIQLASFNNSTNTFTDGSTMPTRTELGESRVIPGPIFREVTTALNSNPGSITVTYVDQDGNSAETTTAQALGNSSPVGTAGFIALNSNDTGVRDVTNITRSGGASHAGAFKLWGVIPIGVLGHVTGIQGLGDSLNLLTSKFLCRRLGASTQIGVFVLNTSAKAAHGKIFFVGDS